MRPSLTIVPLGVACALALGGCGDPYVPAPDLGPPSADAGVSDDASPGPDLADPLAGEAHDRADHAVATWMLAFWGKVAANATTFDWMLGQEWEAVLDVADRRGKNAFRGTARMFYDLQAQRGWLDDYYDDENWIAMALLHAWSVSGEQLYLDQAKVVFADLMSGWDETCCGAQKGGIWWRKAKDGKVTASNAGAVISAARLYQATQDPLYLDFAKKTFDYWSSNMVDPASGHVYDGIGTDGTKNTSLHFTYDEGLFIGACVALYQATGDASYLPLAHKTASYLMTMDVATIAGGVTILSDGLCSGNGEMFKAAGARFLAELYLADPSHTEYRDLLTRSAAAAWTLARDPTTGVISCDWAGPFDATTGDQGSLGSAAVGLAAAARALGPAAQRPALTYEVEEGRRISLGIEARYGDYSGWGYVAGWGADGQSVDLIVDVPQAGTWTAAWRYATGDSARRLVRVNGGAPIPVGFASTGGYESYVTVTQTLELTAGTNVINVAYDSTAAATGYLNLDRLTLTAAP